ncbi:hypothetical protein [Cyanobacterium sp. Dongsha4]|uniref:hypothetical protein n=1 Tax=Cyanobacterium sp. DS4 TaxID=2878255 RepID=UPI002E80458E|nr:hypothetical protein [Cyanobacterium sp. Dongsha4]WVL02517.1 hypothetical protein Dongsha4_18655 [Cyanobacterium sp. Dongsha4]
MLDQYINTQQTVIDTKLAKIAELESIIAQLRKEIRIDEQVKQARVTASTELAQWLEKGKELLRDMAGIFPIEFLEDVKTEVATITDSIKEDYENFADNGSRFLSGSDAIADDDGDDTPVDPQSDDTVTVEVIEATEDDDSSTDDDAIATEDGETDEVVTPEEKPMRLSATQLAKRLGFNSHHEVTSKFKGLSKDSFTQWTAYHDPDQYGWYKVNGKYQIVA